eukprot:3599515-Pyramimonas_sp.AAC.1
MVNVVVLAVVVAITKFGIRQIRCAAGGTTGGVTGIATGLAASAVPIGPIANQEDVEEPQHAQLAKDLADRLARWSG